jgi:hypothetical protein
MKIQKISREDILADAGISMGSPPAAKAAITPCGLDVLDGCDGVEEVVGAHAAVQNLFNLGRHLVRAPHYRGLRVSACADWSRVVA